MPYRNRQQEMIFFLKDKYKPGSAEYELIEFTEKNWEFIIENSMIEVAKQLYIHPSTLSRTVQKLGFKKYNKFRHHIAVQAKEYNDIDSLLIRKDLKENVDNFFQVNKFVLEKTYQNLNLQELEKTISFIENASKIVTFGLGFSGYLGSQFCKHLRLLGKECIDLNNIYDLLKFNASNHGTWLVISQSRITEEIIFGLEKITQNSENIVVLITTQKIELPLIIQHKIFFQSVDQDDYYFGFSSKISLLFLTNLILISLWSKKDISLTNKVEELNLNIKEWVK